MDQRATAIRDRWQDRRPRIASPAGLSIVAEGRESIRDRIAFVMSFGGHGDLARALHDTTSRGEILATRISEAQFRRARRRSCEACIRSRYGLAVALLNLAARVGPGEQCGRRYQGHRRFPAASSLAVTDSAESHPIFEADEDYQATLPEPSGPTCNT